MSTDRHKRKPISFRPPEADRAWLESYAERTGKPVRKVLADALQRYRADIEQEDPRHDQTPQ